MCIFYGDKYIMQLIVFIIINMLICGKLCVKVYIIKIMFTICWTLNFLLWNLRNAMNTAAQIIIQDKL